MSKKDKKKKNKTVEVIQPVDVTVAPVATPTAEIAPEKKEATESLFGATAATASAEFNLYGKETVETKLDDTNIYGVTAEAPATTLQYSGFEPQAATEIASPIVEQPAVEVSEPVMEQINEDLFAPLESTPVVHMEEIVEPTSSIPMFTQDEVITHEDVVAPVAAPIFDGLSSLEETVVMPAVETTSDTTENRF